MRSVHIQLPSGFYFTVVLFVSAHDARREARCWRHQMAVVIFISSLIQFIFGTLQQMYVSWLAGLRYFMWQPYNKENGKRSWARYNKLSRDLMRSKHFVNMAHNPPR